MISSMRDRVLTTMVREGISINDIDYAPRSVGAALELYDELCPDCKALLAGAIEKGLYNDFMWKTMYGHFEYLAGIKPLGTRCKHCEGVRGQLPLLLAPPKDKVAELLEAWRRGEIVMVSVNEHYDGTDVVVEKNIQYEKIAQLFQPKGIRRGARIVMREDVKPEDIQRLKIALRDVSKCPLVPVAFADVNPELGYCREQHSVNCAREEHDFKALDYADAVIHLQGCASSGVHAIPSDDQLPQLCPTCANPIEQCTCGRCFYCGKLTKDCNCNYD